MESNLTMINRFVVPEVVEVVYKTMVVRVGLVVSNHVAVAEFP